MGTSTFRVAVLSNVPEIADMLTSKLARMGHATVATVRADRKSKANGNIRSTEESSSPPEALVAPTAVALESIVSLLRPDLLVTWGFPWRLSDSVLAIPEFGSINFHASLLPRHRGPIPLAWTVRMADEEYGITWHRMDVAYDAGAILAQRSTPAMIDDTSTDVVPRICTMGLRMLGTVMDRVIAREPGDPQPLTGASEEGFFEVDYVKFDTNQTARSLYNQVRAWTFVPRSSTIIGPIMEFGGRRVRILKASLNEPNGHGLRVECLDAPIWILKTEALEH